MKNIHAIILISLMLLYCSAQAEIVEIPLVNLHGTYHVYFNQPEGDATTRISSFQLDELPTEVRGAWIRISGITIVGEKDCLPELGEGPFPYPFVFNFLMKDSITGGSWSAGGITSYESGAYEITVKLTPFFGASWEFLKENGRGEVLAEGGWGFVLMRWGVIGPSASIENAVLILDADFPVPVETNTWGAIKAIYSLSQ
jgi:hypothetical protein